MSQKNCPKVLMKVFFKHVFIVDKDEIVCNRQHTCLFLINIPTPMITEIHYSGVWVAWPSCRLKSPATLKFVQQLGQHTTTTTTTHPPHKRAPHHWSSLGEITSFLIGYKLPQCKMNSYTQVQHNTYIHTHHAHTCHTHTYVTRFCMLSKSEKIYSWSLCMRGPV